MYPTAKYPGYGSFVKNVCEGLNCEGIHIKHRSLIKGKAQDIGQKILKYLWFYVSIICNYFKSYDFIYIHFPNQAVPLLKILYLLKRPKLIINFHGEDLIYPEDGYAHKLGIITGKFCRNNATAIVVPSQYYKDIVLSRHLLDANKVIVSPSGGIRSDFFFPKESANRNSILHIGYVGRLEPDKGILEFLQTCELLNNKIDFKATIIGYGSYYDYCKHFINNKGLGKEITIIEGIAQSRLGDYYRSFDLLIFCSSRISESLGLTGIESLACGTPVIGSNVGGIKSYLKHSINGWLVEVGNADQIIASIDSYLNMNREQREAMRMACIETGKTYYRDSVCKNLADKISKLIYL